MKNYDEAVEYLLNIPKFSKKTTKENLLELLKRLGNPHKAMKIIHVAGTNGKGSVCAFLNTLLLAAKKQTGLFTSPHLVKMNERMRINGKDVSDERFLQVFQQVYQTVGQMLKQGFTHPSFFEYLFVMALVLFEKENVEYVILETGLGGRLDATNIIEHPMLTIITSISFDHTEILGDTLHKIAMEKAGIIKKQTPLVYDYCNKEVADVLESTAQKIGTPVFPVYDKDVKINEISAKYIDFSLDNEYYKCDNVKVSFPAIYQAKNCSLALLSFCMLKEMDDSLKIIEKPHLYVEQTKWEGRMEQIEEQIFIDGAHNDSGMTEFLRNVEAIPCKGERILIFSVVVEKDYQKMVNQLLKEGLWDKIFIAPMNNQRGLTTSCLKKLFEDREGFKLTVCESVSEAFEKAKQVKKQEDIVYCVGSLYMIGEIKDYIERKQRND